MKKVVKKRNRVMVGWNEIATKKDPNDVVPMFYVIPMFSLPKSWWEKGSRLSPKKATKKVLKL